MVLQIQENQLLGWHRVKNILVKYQISSPQFNKVINKGLTLSNT